MDAAAPDAPVVAAGEGTAEGRDALVAQQGVVREEGFEELVLRAHGAVEDAEGLPEPRRVVQQRQVGVFGAADIPEEAAEHADVAEQVRMAHGDIAGLEAAHAEARHGAVPLVGQDGVAAFDEGDQVPEQHLREQQAHLPAVTGSLRHAVSHHDDHLPHPALCQQPVRDAAHMPLIDPACLVFAVPVLQVQDGVLFRRVVGGRRIDQAHLILARDGGWEAMAGHRAVRHTVQRGPFLLPGHGDIQEIHGPAAAVADRQIGAQHVAAVHLQEEILEAAPQVHDALPHVRVRPGQGMRVPELIQHDLLRSRRLQADPRPAVRQQLIALIAVAVRLSEVRVERNGGVQRPGILHGMILLV